MNIITNHDTTYGGIQYWSAYDDDSYDGESSPLGTGHSEAEAVADLKEQMEEIDNG